MVFFSSSLKERNMLTLNRCLADCKLSVTTVEMVGEIEICSFHGLLMDYRDCYREHGKAEEGHLRFMDMLDCIHGFVRSSTL